MHILNDSFTRRLSLIFFSLGIVPTILFTVMPTIFALMVSPQSVGSSFAYLLVFQGGIFLIVVVVGGAYTLRQLVIPIKALIEGAQAIAQGNLSHRVTVQSQHTELRQLVTMFNNMAASVEAMRNGIEDQRATLQEALQVREREFNAMLEISGLVNTHIDLTTRLKHALRIMRDAVNADTIALVLLNDDQQLGTTVFACQDCTSHSTENCEGCNERLRVRRCLTLLDDNLLRQAINDRRPIAVKDVKTDSRVPDHIRHQLLENGARKMMIRPLIVEPDVVGLVLVMRPDAAHIPDKTRTIGNALIDNILVLIANWRMQSQVRTLAILEERRYLANELHDSATQSLFSLSLTAQGIRSMLAHVPDVDTDALDTLVEQTKHIQSEIRTLINEMRPIELEFGDLESALRRHVKSLRDAARVEVRMTAYGNLRAISIPIQQSLNRIAQEALSNVSRHAQATQAQVDVHSDGSTVRMRIADNGVGFDPQVVAHQRNHSLGLISMRERAEMLGGALVLRSERHQGTQIIVQIPLCAEESVDRVVV